MLKSAYDVVKFNKNIAPAVAYVFRNTFVLLKGDENQAEQFSKQTKARIITRDCIMFQGGGIISAQIGSDDSAKVQINGKQMFNFEQKRQ